MSDFLCHFVYVVWVYDRWWWICTKNSWLYKVNAFQSYQFDSESELAINLFHAQLWCLEIEDSGLFKRQFSKYQLLVTSSTQENNLSGYKSWRFVALHGGKNLLSLLSLLQVAFWCAVFICDQQNKHIQKNVLWSDPQLKILLLPQGLSLWLKLVVRLI